MPERSPIDSPVAGGFLELVLAGSHETCNGLIAGLMVGAGPASRAYITLEDELTKPSFGEQLLEKVGLHATASRVVVDETVAALLRGGAERVQDAAGVRILAEKSIREGRFEFAFHAFARRYADEIKALLAELPETVRLEDFTAKEKLDPSAAGVETYAAAHDYEIKGKGAIRGRIDGVIEMRRRLEAHPLVSVERIELSYA